MTIFRKYDLEIAVFVCGAVVMIFELIGSRVVAPYIGTSIYVFTSLIGVILASLSFGYYYGGKLVDLRPNKEPLAFVILFSALAIIATTAIKDLVSALVFFTHFPIEIKSVVISVVLFAPASFFLGIVSPYAVRLRIKDVEKSGGTSGNLYAISTLGSIVGTFGAGFYLIPHFGSFFSLILISVILVLTAFFLLSKKIYDFIKKHIFKVLFLSLAFGSFYYFVNITKSAGIIDDVNTEYNRILIMKGVDQETKKPTIYLVTDPYGTQAGVFADGDDSLVFGYTKFFKIIELLKPEAKSALVYGGAAYTYPRDFLKNFPEAIIDVVEIDPGMTKVAKKYFRLVDDPRMNIFHEDGRVFINNTKSKYDVVFIDAFNSFSSIPFQLTTIEFIKKNKEALNKDGIILVNLISSIEGENGKFLNAEYATYSKVFKYVKIFALGPSVDPKSSQNIILLATDSEQIATFQNVKNNLKFEEYAKKLWLKPIFEEMPVLTDDYAPVEFYKRFAV